jgi:pimeloyl-ACP methyl ester carboxylesterase
MQPRWRRLIGAAASLGLVGVAAFAAGRASGAVAGRILGAVDDDLDPLYVLPTDVIRHDIASHDGGNIHVVERGVGRPLVLVHGVTLQAEAWAPLLHLLADRFRVVAIDVRGHGRSTPGTDGLGRTLAAADLARVLDHLDLGDAIVMGHSMGGIILGELCADFPTVVAERLAALVFMSTAVSHLVPNAVLPAWARVERRTRQRADAGRRLPRVVGDNNRSLLVTRLAFGSHPSGAAVEQTRRLGAAVDVSSYLPLWLDLFDYDGEASLESVDLPAMVLVGSRDLLTPPYMARRIAAHLRHGELHVLPGAGHQLMQERPREVAVHLVGLADRL